MSVPSRETSAHPIHVDDVGVTRLLGDGFERVRWDELVEVKIVTTSEGPFLEDVFFVLVGAHGNGCVVAQSLMDEVGLLARLQQLPGFDNEAVIDAMKCTDDGEFVCWRRVDA